MLRIDSSTKQVLIAASGFSLITIFFAAIAIGILPVPESLKKVDLLNADPSNHRHNILPIVESNANSQVVSDKKVPIAPTLVDTLVAQADSSSNADSLANKAGPPENPLDSTNMIFNAAPKVLFTGDASKKEKVLLLGDSQCGGLIYPVYGYCSLNGHELLASVAWYSSTTRHWAKSDTLDYFLQKYQPTLVIMGVGLNEVFAGDVESRKKHISAINVKIEAAGAKAFWLGPAAWAKDRGIIRAMKEVNDPLFFDATTLSLKRSSDGRHPTLDAYKFWFSHAAAYMTEKGVIDFSATGPYKQPGKSTKNITIKSQRL